MTECDLWMKKTEVKNLVTQSLLLPVPSPLPPVYLITSVMVLPAREVILALCERRGLEVESMEVYLDSNKTPLPLLTSDTSWLSGRTLRIRSKSLALSKSIMESTHQRHI